MSQLKQAELMTICEGAAVELFQHELSVVAKNIADQNTSWAGKRKITLEFTFSPDEERREIKVAVHSKSLIEPIKGVNRTVFLGKNNGKETIFAQDNLQTNLFDQDVTDIGGFKNAGS